MRLTRFHLPALLVLSAATAAQTTHVVVPGYLSSTEGFRYNLTFCAYASQRTQWAEGELGNQARSIRGVGFRFDRVAAQHGVTGRRYAGVQIRCSDGDHTAMSATFSANPRSTPTLVFSKAVALPGHAGGSTVKPQPWLPGLNFAFSSTYQHKGTKDLLLDFTMTGGTLANGGAWSSSRPNYYYLDSPYVHRFQTYGRLDNFGNGPYWAGDRTNTIGCRDSRVGGTRPTARIHLTRYQPTHWSAPFRNKTSFYGIAEYVPPLTNIAFVYGVPKRAGVQFGGVTCNKLYVDMTAAPLVRFVKSGFSTRWASAFDYLLGSATTLIPSNSAWEGLTVMTQAAFNDTGNGQLRLSQATTTTYPPLPPPSLRRYTVWQWDANASTGRRSWIDQDFSVMRYTQ